MRTTSDALVALLLLALVALGGWWVGRAPVPDYVARVDSLTAVVDSVRGLYATKRAATDSVVLRVRRAEYRAADANLALGTAIDSARWALANPDSSVKALRVALAEVIERAEAYRMEVLTYEVQVDTLVRTYLAERQAVAAQVEAMQAVIDTQAEALTQGHCSTFLGPCPTRWQSFGIGAVLAAVVVLALL